MEDSNHPNSNFPIIAYSVFLAVILYAWNPTDAEGMTRISAAILIIIWASIFGAVKRAALGIDLNQNQDENK